MFFSSVDDNCARITPNVDDVTEVTVRVVERVVELLTMFWHGATPDASLLIVYLLQFIMFIIQVHGYCESWWRWRNFIVDCRCSVASASDRNSS
jgi:hypothetical protein